MRGSPLEGPPRIQSANRRKPPRCGIGRLLAPDLRGAALRGWIHGVISLPWPRLSLLAACSGEVRRSRAQKILVDRPLRMRNPRPGARLCLCRRPLLEPARDRLPALPMAQAAGIRHTLPSSRHLVRFRRGGQPSATAGCTSPFTQGGAQVRRLPDDLTSHINIVV